MDDLKNYFKVRQASEKLDVTEEWVRDLINVIGIKLNLKKVLQK